MIRPSRRQVLRAAVVAAAMAALPSVVHRAIAAPSRRPNLLLLTTDDQRAESLGCSGNRIVQTPHIDALAQRGVRFTHSFATTAICMSSRAGLLTGMYTRTHGVDDFAKSLPAKLYDQSYPALLHDSGYRTGFVGKWGIDGGAIPKQHLDYFAGYQGQGMYFPPGATKHLTVVQSEQAIEFLRSCSDQQPFCLAVSFKASHVQDEGRSLPGIYAKYPYDLALEKLYQDQTVPPVQTRDAAPQPEFLTRSLNGVREAPDFSQATYQETMKCLYRLITGVDQAVGKIVAELKNLGLDDNTVIIFTSDHGSFYGEHGFGGKWLMHEESIRTPMIICDPRLPAGRQGITCDEMVLNLDLPATLLDLAGLPKPPGMQGQSLLPLIHGESPKWRSEWFYENHYTAANSIAASEGIRLRDWKYIHYTDTQPVYEQLFDLKNDPREEKNLATDPTHGDRLMALRGRWEIWQKSLREFSVQGHWVDPVV